MKKENLMKTHEKNIPVREAQLLGNTLVFEESEVLWGHRNKINFIYLQWDMTWFYVFKKMIGKSILEVRTPMTMLLT